MGRERIIVLTTVLGLIIGGVAFYLSGKYFPEYTAKAYVEVIPPTITDPMVMTTPKDQKDIRYGHRLSMANLIRPVRIWRSALALLPIEMPIILRYG